MTLNKQLSPHHLLPGEGLKKRSHGKNQFIAYTTVITSYNYAHL